MKILVTGLPRQRSSLIIKTLKETYSLNAPSNQWGETHKFNENVDTWLASENSVFKMWGAFNSNFEQKLESFDGNVVVTYTDDLPLFIAKLLRAHTLRDYSVDLHELTQLSFKDNLEELEKIRPQIHSFRKSLDKIFLNKKIVLKSAFLNGNKSFAHIQSTVDPRILTQLDLLASNWKKPVLESYIKHNEISDYYEYIYKTFGRTIC